jgi:cation:H+ antiporter
VVVVLATVLGGAALESSANLFGASPTSYPVVVFWVAGVWIVNRVRLHPAWTGEAPEATPGRRHVRQPLPDRPHPFSGASTARVLAVFVAGAVVTLAAGIVLQGSGACSRTAWAAGRRLRRDVPCSCERAA